MATGRVPTTANSPLTAKGDLFGYSTTQARVAVGNDGETLVADSSTSTGLRWTQNYAAGKNKIINGDFSIWQRGTSGFAANLYCADRFLNIADGTSTVSQQTFTPGTAPVAGYEGTFYLRQTRTASGTFQIVSQRIEDVRIFAGQTVTLSFWAKADTTVSNEPTASQVFGSGGSSAVSFGPTPAQNITTSWTRLSYTFAVPSISGKTIGTNSYLLINAIRIVDALAHTVDIWGVQLEAGSVATAFQTATGTIQGELAACMRYFYVITSGDQQSITNGFYSSTTDCRGNLRYPVQMRTTPTLLSSVGTDHFAFETSSGVDGLNRLDSARVSNTSLLIYNNTTASGTAGNSGELRTNNASASFTASAEL
jgi:hypothetical protein